MSNPDSYSLLFDKSSFKKAIKYVLDSCVLKCGSKVFQQVTGTPMGSDPVHFIENLFFFSMRTNGYRRSNEKA